MAHYKHYLGQAFVTNMEFPPSLFTTCYHVLPCYHLPLVTNY